ncbi:MAG: Holliday junction branch migration protein RuvA [Clostridia bacterium]
MFYSLTGNVLYTDAEIAVISCSGVGFECHTTTHTLKKIAGAREQVTLLTYLAVREDALVLYGFYDKNELDCFKMLIGVSGVGPKAALSILSELGVDRLVLCVATSDSKSIQKAPNVGAKTAQRVILELKDKIGSLTTAAAPNTVSAFEEIMDLGDEQSQAVDALISLGYSRGEASAAIRTAARSHQGAKVEELIREGLKLMAGKV